MSGAVEGVALVIRDHMPRQWLDDALRAEAFITGLAAALTTPPARSYADGVSRKWFPHLCFAGEPMHKGQFREPWPMDEERMALAKTIFDGWYEGNEDWDSPHNDHLQMRAYLAADAAIRLLSQEPRT